MTAVRVRAWAVPAACLAAAVLCVVAAGRAYSTSFNQCDNMAGTCIRQRQIAAIVTLQSACVAGAVAAVLAAYGWGRWPRLGWWLTAALMVLCVAAAVLVLAADPIDHLNNRWSGWLHD
jgi:hypothetical protein